jgi:glycosyltransferase involved in cell wall biosynthesis
MTADVSVVIPVWDDYVGEPLLDALASVRAQSCEADVVIVDNASRTPLPPIEAARVVSLGDRVSTGAARNAALCHLDTTFVVFLDADDILLPGALATLLENMRRHPGAVSCTLSIVDESTGERFRTPRRFAGPLAWAMPLFQFANTIWALLPTQGCTVMRLSDVRACGGYGDRSYGEDWILSVSLSFRGKVRFIPTAGLRYRRRADSPGSRPLSPNVLLANAGAVRERIRSDSATPRWIRAALPLIGLAQAIAARIAHPAYRSLRALGGS